MKSNPQKRGLHTLFIEYIMLNKNKTKEGNDVSGRGCSQ